jgi:hypothetical protein
MSDESIIGPELLAALEAQARWRRDKEKLEASLTDAEKDMRARFDRYLFGPVTFELSGFHVPDPTCLLVFAEAYRLEGQEKVWALGSKASMKDKLAAEYPYKAAMFTLIAIWLAVNGREPFVKHFSGPVRMPPIPPLPKTWHMHRERVYRGMGIEYTEPQKVVPLRPGLAA